MGGIQRVTTQTEDILLAMARDPTADWYGLALSKACGLKTGTIYPALARLEHDRLVASHWEEVDPTDVKRPARRLYRLTGAGALASGEIARRRENASTEKAPPRALRRPGAQPA